MSGVIVTEQVLKIYRKYGGDFGMLDERGGSEKDRKKVTHEQTFLFSQYVDKLHVAYHDDVSVQLKERALN